MSCTSAEAGFHLRAVAHRLRPPHAEGAGQWPAPCCKRWFACSNYQLLLVGQPPLPPLEHVRVVTPLSSFVILNTLVDFDVAVTM